MGETAHRTGEKCTRKGIVGNEGGGGFHPNTGSQIVKQYGLDGIGEEARMRD